MRAVIYHSSTKALWPSLPDDAYERLFKGFIRNSRPYCDCVFHLTIEGNPGWGDATIWPFEGTTLKSKDIMYNREVMFTQFLKYAASIDTVYWFTEPDARIVKEFPPLADDVDLALLYRDDDVHITPSFRLARKAALPVFEWVLEHFDGPRDWHGDSMAFNALYEAMGFPQLNDRFTWNGVRIELRDYNDYTRKHSKYVRHWKAFSKSQLLAQEG